MMKMSANTTNLTCLLPSIRSFTLQVLIEYLISGPKSPEKLPGRSRNGCRMNTSRNAVIPVWSIISSWCSDIKDETPLHEIDKLFANILIYN